MKLTLIEITNLKRLKAVRLEPSDKGLTVIGGRNGQGKTSVLDGIAYALGGESAAEVADRLGLTLNALRQIKFRVGRMIAAVEAQYGE